MIHIDYFLVFLFDELLVAIDGLLAVLVVLATLAMLDVISSSG